MPHFFDKDFDSQLGSIRKGIKWYLFSTGFVSLFVLDHLIATGYSISDQSQLSNVIDELKSLRKVDENRKLIIKQE